MNEPLNLLKTETGPLHALILQSFAGSHAETLSFTNVHEIAIGERRAFLGEFTHLASGRIYGIQVSDLPQPLMESQHLISTTELQALRDKAAKFDALHSPRSEQLLQAVDSEAARQRERWADQDLAGKSDVDWAWLIAQMATTLPMLVPEHRPVKIVEATAACLNWHIARSQPAPQAAPAPK